MTVPVTAGYPAEPPAPQGPGVRPPFAVPPSERDKRRLWVGLGIGALMMILCCVGGVVGGGVLIAGTAEEMRIEAKKTVSRYLEEVKKENYPSAYGLMCPDAKKKVSFRNFERGYRQDPIRGFSVNGTTDSSSGVVVTATVEYAKSGTRAHKYRMEAEGGSVTVCGQE